MPDHDVPMWVLVVVAGFAAMLVWQTGLEGAARFVLVFAIVFAGMMTVLKAGAGIKMMWGRT